MSLVFCHTADWHLGRTLHGASFDDVHRRFLRWLCVLIAARGVDVLVIAGDVFDRSVPSASAEALFYGFLSELAQAAPGVQVVVVAGNHDGPARLAAPAPLLEHLGRAAQLPLKIVGAVPLDEAGRLEPAKLVVPLRRRSGEACGSLLAVPFLRPSDLSRVELPLDSSAAERVRRIYELALAACLPGRVLATGHGHVRGARLSPDSERVLLGGEEAALPIEVFPKQIDYVALGHMHLAQSLDAGRVRYAGAPLPLAFSERAYAHEVVIGQVEPRGIVTESMRVPPFVTLVRIDGDAGAALELETALERLGAIEAEGGSDAECETWVQVCVRLDAPRVALKRELAEALARSPLARAGRARLVSVVVERAAEVGVELPTMSVDAELAPEAVLARLWRGVAQTPVPAELLDALHEAWREARETQDAAEARDGDVEVAS